MGSLNGHGAVTVRARVRLVRWDGEAAYDVTDPHLDHASDPRCLEIVEIDEEGHATSVYRKPA
jgi:hypothetical protein